MQRLFTFITLLLACTTQAQNGNVGIGTSSPAEKLHVAGNIKADTLKPNAFKLTDNAASGKVLTSDAGGNASWQLAATNSAGPPVAPGNLGYGVWGDCATNGNISNYQPLTDSTGGKSYNFGYKTFLAGNYAITGSRFETVGANTNQGSATIMQNINGSWVAVQKLFDNDGKANDRYGTNVCINDSFAMVSATVATTSGYSGTGAVFIYKHVGNNWIQTQRLIDSTGNAGEVFGYGLCLSGNTLVVGAGGKGFSSTGREGAVFIYNYNGSAWLFRQMLTDPSGIANSFLGQSVSVSGNYLVASQNGYNNNQGAACVFVNNNGTWSFLQKLFDPNGAIGDNFSSSVSISGNYILVGAPGADRDGSVADVGAVCFYRLNGTTWSLQQRLYDYVQGAATDNFGFSVCLSGKYAIIGAWQLDAPYATNAGGAYIYVRTGGVWQQLQRIIDPAAFVNDFAGQDVFLDGTTRNFSIGVFNFNVGMGKVLFGKIN